MRRIEILTVVFQGEARSFEGLLAGALQRAESGGAIRVTDAAFVGRDDESGELMVLESRRGAGQLVTALADFRLQAARRRSLTERTLATSPHAEQLRELGAALAPGAAVVIIAVEHAWLTALTDSVRRTGGRLVADEVEQDDAPAADALVAGALTAALRERTRPGSTPAATPR